MRNLIYRLENGTVVTTMDEAKASGLNYIKEYVTEEKPYKVHSTNKHNRRKAYVTEK